MNRYKTILPFALILLIISMGPTSAQIISVSNVNIGDIFEFSYTKVSQTEIVNGTEYHNEFSIDLIDQPFTIEITGGYYDPYTPMDSKGTDMALIVSRPYDADITYITTYDNDSLNEEEPSNETSGLDEWMIFYFEYFYTFSYMFEYFNPGQLIGDFDVPKLDLIDLDPSRLIIGIFVHNNETFYDLLFGETTEPVIYQNTTTTQDGTDLSTYNEYKKTQRFLDLDADLLGASVLINHTMYGNIGEIEWLYGDYISMDVDIDYGRGIITRYDLEIMMSSEYDGGSLYSITRVASEEYIPVTEPTTTENDETTTTITTTETASTPSLDLDYPAYSFISIIAIGIMIRYRRYK